MIRQQLDVAIENADKVILVVDAKSGILPLDREINDLLRQHNKEVVVAVNKTDNEVLADQAFEFTSLGVEKVIPISCLHNYSISELLDELTFTFSNKSISHETTGQSPKIAIVGRPNVGKSSIVNCFLRENRVIVSETAGTTRDAIEVPFRVKIGDTVKTMTLIDTAGIRFKRTIRSRTEYFSMTRTKASITHVGYRTNRSGCHHNRQKPG